MMAEVKYWLGAVCIYLIAIASAAYCVSAYSNYLNQVQQSSNYISFQSNLYLLLLPLAFICTHIFGLIQLGLVKISRTRVRYEELALVIAAAIILLAGYAVQQRMEYEIRREGYVNCEQLNRSGFRSPRLVYARQAKGCRQVPQSGIN